MNCDCCLSEDGKNLKRFAEITPFTFGEIVRLLNKFKTLDEDHSGRVEFKVNIQEASSTSLCIQELCTLPEIRANPFARRLCRLFSEDGSETLTFRQFVNLIGIFCERTNLDTKIVWAFAMWDFDGCDMCQYLSLSTRVIGDDLLGVEDITKGLKLISSLPQRVSIDSPKARSEIALMPSEVAKVRTPPTAILCEVLGR